MLDTLFNPIKPTEGQNLPLNKSGGKLKIDQLNEPLLNSQKKSKKRKTRKSTIITNNNINLNISINQNTV